MIPTALRSRLKRLATPIALGALALGLAGCNPGVLVFHAPPGSGKPVSGGGSNIPGALPGDSLTGVLYCGSTGTGVPVQSTPAPTFFPCIGQAKGTAGGKPFTAASGIGAFAQAPEQCGSSTCLFKLSLIVGNATWNKKPVNYSLIGAQQLSGQGRGDEALIIAVCSGRLSTAPTTDVTSLCAPSGASGVAAQLRHSALKSLIAATPPNNLLGEFGFECATCANITVIGGSPTPLP